MPELELHLTVEENSPPLLDILSTQSKLSRQALKQAMDKGALWRTRGKHTQRLRRVKSPLHAGDELHLYYNSDILAREVTAAQLHTAEQGYGIWYKPFGMLSQGSKWGDHCTISRSVEKQTQGNAYLVHRLDRAATGLMIIAYEKKIAACFAERFQQRQIDKRYQAIVHGRPATGDTNTLSIDSAIDGKEALSHISLVQYNVYTRRALLEIKIDTGRKHQIRRHLAEAGHPVVGDRLYGVAEDEENLQLCACRLAFTCPKTGLAKEYQLDSARQLGM